MLKCKVFSATKASDRAVLGDAVTAFLANAKEVKEVVDRNVLLSSDNEFHCLTIVIWYK